MVEGKGGAERGRLQRVSPKGKTNSQYFLHRRGCEMKPKLILNMGFNFCFELGIILLTAAPTNYLIDNRQPYIQLFQQQNP